AAACSSGRGPAWAPRRRASAPCRLCRPWRPCPCPWVGLGPAPSPPSEAWPLCRRLLSTASLWLFPSCRPPWPCPADSLFRRDCVAALGATHLLVAVPRADLHARGLARLRIDGHHLRHVKGRLFRDLPALLVARRRTLMARHDVDAFDDDAILVTKESRDAPLLALVAPADDLHEVADLEPLHQSTSGASEMIFMNFLARSSRATGPKMRVPIGSRSLLMRTALLPS